MFTKAFWKATLERVIRSFAASLAAVVGVGAVSVLEIDWEQALAVAGGAALVTLLLCVTASQTGTAGPAFGKQEVTSPPAPPLDEEGKHVA